MSLGPAQARPAGFQRFPYGPDRHEAAIREDALVHLLAAPGVQAVPPLAHRATSGRATEVARSSTPMRAASHLTVSCPMNPPW